MTGAELEIRRTDVPAAFTDQLHMARVLADSTLLPTHLRGKPANVLVVLQGARALDVAAFWAFQSMHVIEGKLGMAAELMRALVIRAGHRIRVVERTAQRAVVEIHRSDRDVPYVAEFTWDEAKAAKLTEKDNWRKYPKSMLVARATAVAVRDECPDVLFGVVYTPDELGVITDDEGRAMTDGEVIEPLTEDEVSAALDAITNAHLSEVVAVWGHVTERGGQFAKFAINSDDTLLDALAQRIALDASVAGSKAEVRALWDVARTLRVEATVKVAGQDWQLASYLKHAATGLPDEVEPTGPVITEVEVDHARQMQEAALASWDGATEEQRRESVFDRLREQREAAAEVRAERARKVIRGDIEEADVL